MGAREVQPDCAPLACPTGKARLRATRLEHVEDAGKRRQPVPKSVQTDAGGRATVQALNRTTGPE